MERFIVTEIIINRETRMEFMKRLQILISQGQSHFSTIRGPYFAANFIYEGCTLFGCSVGNAKLKNLKYIQIIILWFCITGILDRQT